MNNILEEIVCRAIYSFADDYSGYNMIHIVQIDWYKMAFTTPWGTFIIVVMPQLHLKGQYIFSDFLHKSIAVFIDNFCVHSEVSHSEDLRNIMLALNAAENIMYPLDPKKNILFVLRSILLGHLVLEEWRLPDPEKVEVIVELPPTENVPKMRSVLDHIGW